MRPLTLLLNGQPADLPASTRGLIKLTQARTSLSDVAARVGEYSYALTLPPTRQNQRLFGVDKLHPQGLHKFGYYGDYPCELRVGGQQLQGVFRLSSLSPAKGYTGNLIGAGFSWALALGDTKLNDLVFPTLTYDGSQLAGILSQDCDETDVQFPLVAFGNYFRPPTQETQADGTTKEVPAPPSAVLDYPLSVDDYPPGVYYVNVLRQIFRSIGWELQGRELDADFWRSVVLTCAGADVAAAWPWGSLLPMSATGQGQQFSYYGQGPGNGYTNTAVGFSTLPGDGPELSGDSCFLPVPLTQASFRPTRALDLSGSTYTALRAGLFTFEWTATLSGGHQYFGGPNIDSHDAYVQALLRPIGIGLVVRRGGQDFAEGDGGLLRGDPNAGPLSYAAGQDRVLTPQRLDVAGQQLGTLQLGAYQGTALSVYLEEGDSVTLATFARRCVFDGTNNLLAYRSQSVFDYSAAALACTRYADNDGVSVTELQPAKFLPPLLCKDLIKEWLLRTDSFLLADTSRQVATLLSRAELSLLGGEPVDLTALCDPQAVEYLPAAGAGVGSFVFSPAALPDDPLVLPTADIVTAPIGPGESSQAITSLFAPVGVRSVYLPSGVAPVPTCATTDALKQNGSEAERDPSQQAPRLVRYTGPDATLVVPFGDGTVPLAGAAWDGPLCWDGAAGAVATYYQGTIDRAARCCLARVPVSLSPAAYCQLQPGRRVALAGSAYTVEAVEGYDPADEGALATVTLAREV